MNAKEVSQVVGVNFYQVFKPNTKWQEITANLNHLLMLDIPLDDIFDKLDASRVEQIVKLVSGDRFGQIFITDTNRDHLDKIMQKIEGEYKVFGVVDGSVNERKEQDYEKE